jgi:hypothetical protein
MKKTRNILLTSVLVLGFLALSFSNVLAAPNLADPKATPTLPGTSFTATVLTEVALPGSEVGANQMIFPIGFMDEAQFSGKGLMVSGLKAGETVTVSFDFYAYLHKWAGSIYQWSGAKWMKLPTTVTLGEDGGTTWATSSGLGNGTYALIIGNYGPPEPPVVKVDAIPTEIPVD